VGELKLTNWVLSSNFNENRADKTSVLAIAETVTALIFYWWFSSITETYWLLLLSSFVAFFVLLRSPKSLKLGRRAFLSYLDSQTPTKLVTIGLCVVGILVGTIAAYWTSTNVRALGTDLNHSVVTLIALLVFANAFVATLACISGGLVQAGGMATALLSLFSNNAIIERAQQIDVRATSVTKSLRSLGLLFLGVGFGLGVFTRAVFIRCLATARYLLIGINFFPKNWLRLTLLEDAFTPPAIVPGLPERHFLHPTSFLSRKKMAVDEWVFTLVFLPFVVLPSWVYRLTLKSTAWLYAPVAWIAYIPRKLRFEAGRLIWIGYVGRTHLDWLVFASALCVLVFSAVTAFDQETYRAAKALTEGQPWTPLHLLFAFDTEKLYIWHALTIPSASLTLLLIVWTDVIRKRMVAGEMLFTISLEIRLLLALNQTKNLLTITWIFVTFMSFARTAWLLGHFPDWLSKVFRFIEPISRIWS